MKPKFFETPADFRQWLEQNHTTDQELWVGFYKKSTGKPSVTWPESVDQALCFGWIDGLRKSQDEESYVIRFSPRQPRSPWSVVNIGRAEALIAAGLMQPAGRRAFEARPAGQPTNYSYEHKPELPAPYTQKLQQNQAAWEYFQAQPASYRRAATGWIVSAKKEETRLRRLDQLIADSAAGQSVPPLRWTAKPK